eukprot:3515556-Rhodomonas_salina.1
MAAKVDKLVGVELSPTRLDYATLALEQLRPQLTRQAKGGVTAPDCIHVSTLFVYRVCVCLL